MFRAVASLSVAILIGMSATPVSAAAGRSRAPALTPEAVNAAVFSARSKPSKSVDPVILRAQILLDRQRFSPGLIDGRDGENFKKAISAFTRARGLPESRRIDDALWAKLIENETDPALVEYRITRDDVKGPFAKLPRKMEQMVELERLGYASPVEMLAERFHMDEALLRALNPGKPFDRPETTIVVANVGSDAPQAKRPDKADKVVRIVVDRTRGELSAYAKDDRLIAVYPASVGSRQTPSPVGTHKVQAIVKNPSYTYRPEYAFKGVKAKKPFTLKPGPNGPVGSVWIDLDEPTYGIHGTAHPERIGKTSSEGCVRLTNWDAEELATLAQKGTAVEFGSEG